MRTCSRRSRLRWLALGAVLSAGCGGTSSTPDGGRDASPLDAPPLDAPPLLDAHAISDAGPPDATIIPATPCDLPPACIGELCYALGVPVGSGVSISFAEPDGSLWVIDGTQRTWRLHAGAWSIVDPRPVRVFLADGDLRLGIRDPETDGAVLVVQTGDAPFEPMAGAPATPSGAFGVSSSDLWVLAGGVLHRGNGTRFTETPWPYAGSFVSAWAPASDDLWLTVSVGLHGNEGQLQHWDGERWSEVALPTGVEPRWIAGHPRGDRWLLSTDGGLLDGTDGWRRVAAVADSHYPGAPSGPPYAELFPTPDSLAVTTDGAVWVARPDGLLGRWLDGAWAPLIDPPEVRGRLVAQGDGVWMGGPGSHSRAATFGLSRIEPGRQCGGERVGPIDDLIVAAGRPVVSWRVPHPEPTHGTVSFVTALGAAGWRTTHFAPRRVADLFEGGGVSWALTTDDAETEARTLLWRLEGDRWEEQATLDGGVRPRGHRAPDGTVWVTTESGALSTVDIRTQVFQVHGGLVTLALDEAISDARLLGHGDAVWLAGYSVSASGEPRFPLWRWDGSAWAPMPDAPAQVTAVSATGELWTSFFGVHRGDGSTWQPVCPTTSAYAIVPRDGGVYLQTGEGWVFHDGTDLRAASIAGWALAFDGETAWVGGWGLMSGALAPPGAIVPCPP